MDGRFPKALEAVHVGGGLWLRVKVLSLDDALKGVGGLQAAVGIAVQAMAPDEDERARVLAQQQRETEAASRYHAAMAPIARQAVVAYAWGDAESEPDQWAPLSICRDVMSEDRDGGKFCVATLDQVSAAWVTRVCDTALRAAFVQRDEVRPLSGNGT